jgi:aminopeptidase
MEHLSVEELIKLIKAVFPRQRGDRKLAILIDIPQNSRKDHHDWQLRRAMAYEWYKALKIKTSALGLEKIALIAYPDVESNNADLPRDAYLITGSLPSVAYHLEAEYEGEAVMFNYVFQEFQLFLAPTEYSTTAPLKNAAKQYGFRAATMPGFSPEMIPALRIDYNEVSRRVSIIKEKVDAAEGAEVIFKVDNQKEFEMFFDLRYRQGHLSSGRFPDKGTAGNLPSGETYIVPYEGEKGEKTKTRGILPVQLDNDVVLFTVEENRAVSVEGEGEAVETERDHLQLEPAYGNMAELGFGVLADFGLTPINQVLLDEKLGFHIAFGRSDHFGGAVGPKDFSSPKQVIHQDRIYIPATQPRISVKSVVLAYPNNQKETIIENDKYLVF